MRPETSGDAWGCGLRAAGCVGLISLGCRGWQREAAGQWGFHAEGNTNLCAASLGVSHVGVEVELLVPEVLVGDLAHLGECDLPP